MSGQDLVDAVLDGNFPEVVRLVDEEHVDMDYRDDRVSFRFSKRNLNHLFLFCM